MLNVEGTIGYQIDIEMNKSWNLISIKLNDSEWNENLMWWIYCEIENKS